MKKAFLFPAIIWAAALPLFAGQETKPDTHKKAAPLTEEEREIIEDREILENLELLQDMDKFVLIELFAGEDEEKEKTPARPESTKKKGNEK